MTVYVLNKGYDYEGESTLGVFSTSDAAKLAAESDWNDWGNTPCGDEWVEKHNFSYRESGCSTYYVYAFEVKGAA